MSSASSGHQAHALDEGDPDSKSQDSLPDEDGFFDDSEEEDDYEDDEDCEENVGAEPSEEDDDNDGGSNSNNKFTQNNNTSKINQLLKGPMDENAWKKFGELMGFPDSSWPIGVYSNDDIKTATKSDIGRLFAKIPPELRLMIFKKTLKSDKIITEIDPSLESVVGALPQYRSEITSSYFKVNSFRVKQSRALTKEEPNLLTASDFHCAIKKYEVSNSLLELTIFRDTNDGNREDVHYRLTSSDIALIRECTHLEKLHFSWQSWVPRLWYKEEWVQIFDTTPDSLKEVRLSYKCTSKLGYNRQDETEDKEAKSLKEFAVWIKTELTNRGKNIKVLAALHDSHFVFVLPGYISAKDGSSEVVYED